ncbi:MAG: hypothetical protein ACKO85_11385 [Isosphaeraceae bacterium]
MSRGKILAFMTVAVLAVGVTAWSQPPEDAPRGGGRGRGPGGPSGPGGPAQRKQGMPQSKFKVGTVIPPFLREEMELTKDQQEKINDLEAEVKSKLEKILKKDQLEMFNRLPMGGPGGPGFGGQGGRRPGGPGGPGGPPGGGFDGPPPGGGRGPDGDFPPPAKKKGAGNQRKGAQPKRPGPPEE